jgi:Zn-dependent protease with chaperone function
MIERDGNEAGFLIMTPPNTTGKCPQCGEQFPVSQNFPRWCPACDWGLAEPRQERKGLLRPRLDRWSARQVEALFRQVSSTAVRGPGWSPARAASYAVAICVHLSCLALIGVGIWLIVAIPSVGTIILAILALLLGVELRPRLGSFRKLKNVRYREDAPVLFGVLDRVAAAVGARPADAVVVNAGWNASYSAVGWRRRRVVSLGLPLWDAVPADQRVAILAHEFAHGVNGDARHGAVVGTSLAALTRLHSALRPLSRRRPVGRMAGNEALAAPFMALLRAPVTGLLMLQQLISLRSSQRAEYLADAIAARVSSPASMADALDSITTGRDTYRFVIERRRFRDGKTGFWDQLHSSLAAVPDSEKERRRRESGRDRPQMAETHPPAHLRIRVLRGLPPHPALVSASEAEEEQIRAELARDYAGVASYVDGAVT